MNAQAGSLTARKAETEVEYMCGGENSMCLCVCEWESKERLAITVNLCNLCIISQ